MAGLRLLMLNYEFPPIGGGGAQAHANLLREYGQRNNLQVDVLTSAATPGFTQETLSSNITIYRVGLHKKKLHYWRKQEVLEWLFKSRSHYKRLICQNQYDLVHAFFGFPSGWLCYRSAGKLPYMISLRGSDVPGQNARLQKDYKILAPIFRGIWQKAELLVACSHGLKGRALRFFPDVAMEVIPNGVLTDRFVPNMEPSSQPLRLISVGRLSETKRLDLLIETVALLRQRGLNVSLQLVGDGALYDSLKDQIQQLEIESYVTLKGRVEPEDMPALYQASDLYISGTYQEGMSNAMLEAMASGLPIVTTICEGVDELISDNGVVVHTPTADAMAEAITRLLSDHHKYCHMSLAARNKALTFSWSSVADQYITHYQSIAHAGRHI